MTRPEDPQGDLEAAIRHLAREARRQLRDHPWGHLLDGRREPLSLRLDLPLNSRDEDLDKAVDEAAQAVSEGLREVLAHRAVVRPGRLFCLRCGAADCEHARPEESRQVFIGYGPTGLPRFRDFGQWLLELKDPRISRLYGARPALLTQVSSDEELFSSLLPAFRDREVGFRIHGQVTAGWFRLPNAAGDRRPVAVTFQIVSTQGKRGPRRFDLNLLGRGPDGEDLDDLFQRIGRPPWTEAVAWAREALGSLKESRRRGKGRRSPPPIRRLEGILGGFARRLEKSRRAKDRKTIHARERHEDKDRPTEMALPDLRRAKASAFFFDTRHETMVVLGEKGRAHVFSPEGKHVTSVRYSPAALERRTRKGPWRQATAEQRALLEKHLGTGSAEETPVEV